MTNVEFVPDVDTKTIKTPDGWAGIGAEQIAQIPESMFRVPLPRTYQCDRGHTVVGALVFRARLGAEVYDPGPLCPVCVKAFLITHFGTVDRDAFLIASEKDFTWATEPSPAEAPPPTPGVEPPPSGAVPATAAPAEEPKPEPPK